MRVSSPVLFSTLCLLAIGGSASAQSNGAGREVTYIKDIRQLPDADWQAQLRQGNAWSDFAAQHPQWVVEFNEASGLPRRAFGPPILVSGATPEERAMNFITSELEAFELPLEELVPMSAPTGKKVSYVHYAQEHAGLVVLGSHLMVKLDAQGRVIAFGADVFDASAVDLQPLVGEGVAATNASEGLSGVVSTTASGLRLLPIPNGHAMDVRLVREVTVNTTAGTPGRYLCWVDAHTGALLSRRNLVVTEHDHDGGDDDAADAQMNGTVYLDGATMPATVEGLPDLRVTVNGNFLFADANGFLPTGITGPVTATMPLRGRWSIVTTLGVNPTFNTTLNEGSNTVDWDTHANIRERTAYFHVSRIHNHATATLPGFTGMDIALPTKVDVSIANDSCNAYYDGSSINFYAQSPGCRALSLYGDVIYHEYGHGINDMFYQSQGSTFSNGAMNEGYADVWALTLTQNPVMTLGWKIGFPDSYIRRYDEAPKVYPLDLVGEVHRDGEIIAGAWWDTYRLLGWDMPLTLQLFAAAMQQCLEQGADGVQDRRRLERLFLSLA